MEKKKSANSTFNIPLCIDERVLKDEKKKHYGIQMLPGGNSKYGF